MAKHLYSVGTQVVIINSTMSGRPIVEGRAIIKKLLDADEYYRVKFVRDSGLYDRFVDPAAQADPAAFVAKMIADLAMASEPTPSKAGA